MRWARSRYDITAGDRHPFFVADWQQDTGDAKFQHRVVVGAHTTGEWPELKPSTMWLMRAYILLHSMPENALAEACEALSDVYESHWRPMHRAIHLQPSQIIKGTLKPARSRPAFRMADE